MAPTPSDEYDEGDDFFNNAETLDILAAVEERAIRAASQVPKASQGPTSTQGQGYHHTLAKPRKAPIVKRKDPAPLNTEPRAGNSGFGWEYGGKRSIEGNVERHLKAIDERQSYWGTNKPYGNVNGDVDVEDDSPPDVVLDASGKYGLGPDIDEGEAIVTDNRKAQQAALGESLGIAKPRPQIKNHTSAEAAAARRKAIAEATSVPPPSSNRPPLSRSNSASSSSSGRFVNRQSTILNNGSNNVQHQSSQKFGTNRLLSRSISAGGQVFHRPQTSINAAAGPSRLPAVPSQINEISPYGSQGAPLSQGAAERQAAIELEQEKRRRQELETEIAALKAQAAKSKGESAPPLTAAGQGIGGDAEKRVRDLQAEVWQAKGEAETMRRAQKEEHNRHLAEIENLRAALANKDVQIKERETMQKRAVESIKHQAVFSNHAMQNSAMKNKQYQQSQQRFGSSQRPQAPPQPQPTPIRNGAGSPGRQMLFDAEATPLAKSVKGKEKALPPPPPPFGGFNNAFAATPTVSRVKRQRTEAPSPQPMSSPTKAQTPSPVRQSPAKRNRDEASSPVFGDPDQANNGDGAMDFGDFHPVAIDVDAVPNRPGGVVDDEPAMIDQKAELLYYLFNHVATSSFQQSINLTDQPTIYRIFSYRPPQLSDPTGKYAQACSDLLKACGGSTNYSFEQLAEVVLETLWQMLGVVEAMLRNIELITIYEIAVLFSLLSLSSSTILLFPSLVQTLAARNAGAMCHQLAKQLYADPASLANLRERLDKDNSVENVYASKSEHGWFLELADVLVEFCEIMTFCAAEDSHVWEFDQLIEIILYLTSTNQHHYIVRRGVDLFFTSSCFASNFQTLISIPEEHAVKPPVPADGNQPQSPLIERMSRWLISPPPTSGTSISEEECFKMILTILRGLCMLAISHPDATILMAQRSILIYALIIVLQRQSTKVWGVHAENHSVQDAMAILDPALTLMHYLVFPSPLSLSSKASSSTSSSNRQIQQPSQSQSQSHSQSSRPPHQNQNRRRSQHVSSSQVDMGAVVTVLDDGEVPLGINLPDRLRAVASLNEFNGLQHIFVSALGCMAYGSVSEDILPDAELRSVQFLAQDLLETVIEGPEGDSIFEIYVVDDEYGDNDGGGSSIEKGTTQDKVQNDGSDNDEDDDFVELIDADEFHYVPMDVDE